MKEPEQRRAFWSLQPLTPRVEIQSDSIEAADGRTFRQAMAVRDPSIANPESPRVCIGCGALVQPGEIPQCGH